MVPSKDSHPQENSADAAQAAKPADSKRSGKKAWTTPDFDRLNAAETAGGAGISSEFTTSRLGS